MPAKCQLAPSIFAYDFAHLADGIAIAENANADQLHCDVMDGQYVPAIALGAQAISAIRACTQMVLDVHLMVVQPEKQIDVMAEAGADRITFHPEASLHPHRLLSHIISLGVGAGIAVNPGSSLSTLDCLLPLCEQVLVMGVNPGLGGQTMLSLTFQKIKALADLRSHLKLHFKIAVDGGVNAKNAFCLRRMGADVLIVGSAFYRAEDKRDLAAGICGKEHDSR